MIETIDLLPLGKGNPDKCPYFVNCTIKPKFLEYQIRNLVINGPEYRAEIPNKILVDFSSPNIAKNMHVGHLRSTIIGESLCRVLESLGHKLDRVNHIGDWGTQFGMLITHLDSVYPNYLQETPNIQDLQIFYQDAKLKFDNDEEFRSRARQAVVNLQRGESKEINAWRTICDISKQEYQSIYRRLNVTITDVGESFYNDMIDPMIKDLQNRRIIGNFI